MILPETPESTHPDNDMFRLSERRVLASVALVA
jgi:hypothetical protein